MALCNEVVNLISVTHTTNARANLIPNPTSREVMANKVSVRRDEAYQAMAAGLKAECVFEVRTVEYRGEELLSHNGKEYRILRTYDRTDEWTELTCGRPLNETIT